MFNCKASALSSAHCPTLVHPDINRTPCPPNGPMGDDTKCSNLISLQRPSSDRRLRKASDQPSGHSQVTESSGSTPESCPDLSDEDFVPGKWLLEFYTCWVTSILGLD